MQCTHPNVVAIFSPNPKVQIKSRHIGEYSSSSRQTKYYCHFCGMKSSTPFGNLVQSTDAPTASTNTYFDTGSTKTHFSVKSDISTNPKKMTNQEFFDNLNRVKSDVNKKKLDAQQMLEILRTKTRMEEDERKHIILNINNKLQSQIEKDYKNLDVALAKLSEKIEKEYNEQLNSAILNKLKNGFSSYEQTTIKLNDTAKKIKETPKPKVNIATPISRAILLVKTLFFRPTIDSIEIDGTKYIDIGFSEPLDIESEKLDFFGTDVKVVEWAEVPKELFGLKSKIFGVKKDVKTLRITEEELIKQYESTMGSKIS